MTDTMNAEIKAQWTAALRSGEYEQGTGQLSRSGKYCCLGVLCDLAVKAEVIPAPWLADDDEWSNDEYGADAEELALPTEVMQWAGLRGCNPEVDPDSLPEGVKWSSPLARDNDENNGTPALANMNDGGTPFALIADIIDQQL